MTRTNAAWLTAYILFLVGIIWGTNAWRDGSIDDLSQQESVESWREFGEKVAKEADENTPTRHTISRRNEPPMLVYLRERFWVILLGAILFGSIFFGIGMFLARNLWGSSYTPNLPAESDSESKT